jgi:putative lipoic acid-binding regulatory protein
MTNGKEEQKNILCKEIESWSNFECTLREEDSILLKKMVNECQKEEYAKAFNSKGEYNSAEALFMALIFQQQKMINKLIEKVSKYQVNQKND